MQVCHAITRRSHVAYPSPMCQTQRNGASNDSKRTCRAPGGYRYVLLGCGPLTLSNPLPARKKEQKKLLSAMCKRLHRPANKAAHTMDDICHKLSQRASSNDPVANVPRPDSTTFTYTSSSIYIQKVECVWSRSKLLS